MDLVIIPTYNEALTLENTLEDIFKYSSQVEVLVVDDNSPDGTGDIAASLCNVYPQLHVLHRVKKEGLAAAYIAGFRWALAQGSYCHLIEMDADGSHRAVDIPNLLARAHQGDRPDIVIGSRWIVGGSVENWPKKREFLSRLGNIYIALWIGLKVKDATGGFRVYKTDFLNSLELAGLCAKGYYFQVEMTKLSIENKARVVEVPIKFLERKSGHSKMSGSIVIESLSRVTTNGLKKRGGEMGAFLKKASKNSYNLAKKHSRVFVRQRFNRKKFDSK